MVMDVTIIPGARRMMAGGTNTGGTIADGMAVTTGMNGEGVLTIAITVATIVLMNQGQ